MIGQKIKRWWAEKEQDPIGASLAVIAGLGFVALLIAVITCV